MRILDVTCPYCDATYQVAVSDQLTGKGPGHFDCQVCAEVADRWDDSKLRVHRLATLPNNTALRVATKPIPLV